MRTVVQHIDEVLRRISAPSNSGSRREAEFYWDRLEEHEQSRLARGLFLGTQPRDAWCAFIERRAVEDRIRRVSDAGVNFGRFQPGAHYQ